MSPTTEIEIPQAELADICRRYQVKELSLFGSAVRGELRPESDIDLLVEFLPEARLGLLRYSALTREISVLLGRPVDLVGKEGLKPRVRPTVLAEACVLYAA